MNSGRTIAMFVLFSIPFLLLLLLLHTAPLPLYAAVPGSGEKWAGVDEAVVEKIAAEHGRKATKPLINTDHGDLLLFVFLLAGALGGFAGGYYWRKLVEQRARSGKGAQSA
jgi:cobalt/nickel transport protein